jgi:hypothetical protein
MYWVLIVLSRHRLCLPRSWWCSSRQARAAVMGIAFGGGGCQTVFGSSGAGNFLTRLTPSARHLLRQLCWRWPTVEPVGLEAPAAPRRQEGGGPEGGRGPQAEAADRHRQGHAGHREGDREASGAARGDARTCRRPPAGAAPPTGSAGSGHHQANDARGSSPGRRRARRGQAAPAEKPAEIGDQEAGGREPGRRHRQAGRRGEARRAAQDGQSCRGARCRAGRGRREGERQRGEPEDREGQRGSGEAEKSGRGCGERRQEVRKARLASIPFARLKGWATTSWSWTCAQAAGRLRFALPADSDIARALCDRHFGIGGRRGAGDPSGDSGDAACGSSTPTAAEAEMCGNGLRCVAKVLYEKDPRCGARSCASTPAPGLLECGIEADGRPGAKRPGAVGSAAPLTRRDPHDRAGGRRACVRAQLSAGGRCLHLHRRLMGNPHVIIFVDDEATRHRCVALARCSGRTSRPRRPSRAVRKSSSRGCAPWPRAGRRSSSWCGSAGCGITLA